MSTPVELTLSGLPPSVWVAYGQRMRVPGKYLTGPAREWRNGAVLEARSQHRGGPLLGRLEVTVEFRIRSRGKWDIDNRFKLLLDALTEAGIWQDDSQIDSLTSKIRVNGRQKGIQTVISVREVE